MMACTDALRRAGENKHGWSDLGAELSDYVNASVSVCVRASLISATLQVKVRTKCQSQFRCECQYDCTAKTIVARVTNIFVAFPPS